MQAVRGEAARVRACGVRPGHRRPRQKSLAIGQMKSGVYFLQRFIPHVGFKTGVGGTRRSGGSCRPPVCECPVMVARGTPGRRRQVP